MEMSEPEYRDIELVSGTVIEGVSRIAFPGDGTASLHTKGSGYYVVPAELVPEEERV